MIVFRIAHQRYAADLSGRGAELYGGRWNSIGTPLLYTSTLRSLCILEHLVHLPKNSVLEGFVLITIEFPDDISIFELTPSILPEGWRENPGPTTTKRMGDDFFSKKQFLAMRVPSAIVPSEFNLLLNPRHKDFDLVKIASAEPFVYDQRLLQ